MNSMEMWAIFFAMLANLSGIIFGFISIHRSNIKTAVRQERRMSTMETNIFHIMAHMGMKVRHNDRQDD